MTEGEEERAKNKYRQPGCRQGLIAVVWQYKPGNQALCKDIYKTSVALANLRCLKKEQAPSLPLL